MRRLTIYHGYVKGTLQIAGTKSRGNWETALPRKSRGDVKQVCATELSCSTYSRYDAVKSWTEEEELYPKYLVFSTRRGGEDGKDVREEVDPTNARS